MSQPKPVARKHFRLSSHPQFRVTVCLWASVQDLRAWADHKQHGVETAGSALAYVRNKPYSPSRGTVEKGRLCTLHIARPWTMDQLFHELQHVTFQLQHVTMGPMQVSAIPMGMEEPICYSMGDLQSRVYRWLWKQNPSEKWRKADA